MNEKTMKFTDEARQQSRVCYLRTKTNKQN